MNDGRCTPGTLTWMSKTTEKNRTKYEREKDELRVILTVDKTSERERERENRLKSFVHVTRLDLWRREST